MAKSRKFRGEIVKKISGENLAANLKDLAANLNIVHLHINYSFLGYNEIILSTSEPPEDRNEDEEVHSQPEVENVAEDPMSQSDPNGDNIKEEKQKKKKRRTELLHSSSTFLNPDATLQPCKEERAKLCWQLEHQFRSKDEFEASAICKEIRYLSFASQRFRG